MTAGQVRKLDRRAQARAMTEEDLLDAVIATAGYLGWLIHHDRPARTERGWRTAVQGDIGFPDLVLARPPGRVLFVELKSERGLLSAAQETWLAATGGVVWRPGDWLDGTIEKILRQGGAGV